MAVRLIVCILLAALVFIGPVRYNESDSRFSLLTAQALVQHHTVYFDDYCKKQNLDCDHNYRIGKFDHHYFYYFPLGNSFVSLPIIAITTYLGFDVLKDEIYIQRFITSLCLILIYLTMLKISDIFLSKNISTLISTVFILCTGMTSTLGSALWSHDFAILFALLAIYFSLPNNQKNFFFISLSLFIAYLCRPTMALLSISTILYFMLYDWKKALYIALGLFALLLSFCMFSHLYYPDILPPYYLPQRLSNTEIFTAILGNTVSPSRGLFIFSPFLLVLFFYKINQLFRFWWIFGIVWPIFHLLTVSRFPVWWGGYSFGPRLMVDALPGLFIFSIATWPKEKFLTIKNSILTIAILFSFYVNTWQGRFNIDAAINWNKKYLTGSTNDSNVFFDWPIAQCVYPKT